MFSSSRTRATESPTRRDWKYASGRLTRWRNSRAPSSTSMRLVVWLNTIGSQDRQHALEDDHDRQTDHQDVEGRQAAVDQHLVHHDLEEERTDQREQLQEQRNQ